MVPKDLNTCKYKCISVNMPKKRITLSVDSRIYNKYRDYCKEKGIILSKQVEFFLKKELDKIEKENEDK